MKPSTAISFILCGGCLVWRNVRPRTHRGVRLALLGVVGLIAGLTLAEEVLGFHTGFDEALFHGTLLATRNPNPGAMSAGTAICFLLIVGALASSPLEVTQRVETSQLLAGAALAIGGVGALGYFYGVEALYRISLFSSMALHTALAFVALSLGTFFLTPHRGALAQFNDPHSGGRLSRQLLPLVVLFLLGADRLSLQGERSGLYDRGFGAALMALANIVFISGLVWWGARTANRGDRERERSEALKQAAADEQSRINQRLEAAEARARMGSYELDLRTGEVLWSRQMYTLFGRNPASEPPKLETLADVVDPEDREAVGSLHRRLLEGEQAVHAEFRTSPAQGPVRHFEIRCEVTETESGVPARAAGVVLDVTERKNLEIELARYEAIVTHSDDAIVAKTLEGVITHWNAGAEAVFGYTREEAVGQSIAMLFPPDKLDEEEQLMVRLRKGESISHFESVRRCKDGTLIDVSDTISPVRDASGRLVGASKIARDITARKRRERQLAASLREIGDLKTALDEHAIVAFTNARGDITYVNDKFCEISKFSREELIGQNHRIINSGYHPPEFFRDMWTTISHGRVWKSEIKNRAKDGSIYWVHTTIVPFLGESGKPVQYVAVRTDITDRKQTEEALRKHSAALERSNRALEQFAYIASHDLQEPLRGVSGCVQLLERNYHDQLDDRAKRLIDLAVSNAARMHNLIIAVLDYSRMERTEGPFEQVNAADVLGDCERALATSISETGAEITSSGLGTVRADRGQLTQLLQNLLSNALKFRGSEPPRIHISCVPVEIASNESHEFSRWEFSVSDNGVGFDLKHADRIFKAFQRLHTPREYPGTGIGLAICKRVVERHGGKIWVESEPGHGATFKFTLAREQGEN